MTKEECAKKRQGLPAAPEELQKIETLLSGFLSEDQIKPILKYLEGGPVSIPSFPVEHKHNHLGDFVLENFIQKSLDEAMANGSEHPLYDVAKKLGGETSADLAERIKGNFKPDIKPVFIRKSNITPAKIRISIDED